MREEVVTGDSVRGDAWRCGSGDVVRAMSWRKILKCSKKFQGVTTSHDDIVKRVALLSQRGRAMLRVCQ